VPAIIYGTKEGTATRSFVLSLIAAAGLQSFASATESPSVSFDIRVNIADQREVRLAATVPDRTTHLLQVDGELSLELRISSPPWGGRWMEATVMNTAGGAIRKLALMDWPSRADDQTQVQWLSFSVCGDRIISLRDAPPGRCADLQPIAKPDLLYGECGIAGNNCIGPYEGMPATITSHERIAPLSEPGEPLTVTGRVLGPDGRPRAGVIVYGYQTDSHGVYPAVVPPRSRASNYHGRLRGWARSDAQGRYTFDTIRPGSYGGNPEHIHMHVIEPGCATYIIDELMFAGDPMFLRLTPEQRQSETPGRGGPGIGKLRRKGKGWEVTRDIHLGENIPGYEACEITN
jgi:protocatechuate 3,4-dioxygenase beta subunit